MWVCLSACAVRMCECIHLHTEIPSVMQIYIQERGKVCLRVCECVRLCAWIWVWGGYGLFCRISPLLQGSFAKETYSLKEPTNRSHPIIVSEPGEGKEIVHAHVCAHVRVCLYVCIRVCIVCEGSCLRVGCKVSVRASEWVRPSDRQAECVCVCAYECEQKDRHNIKNIHTYIHESIHT